MTRITPLPGLSTAVSLERCSPSRANASNQHRRFRAAARTLVGGDREATLEHRLFNAISLLNGATNVGGAFVLAVVGTSAEVFALHLVSGALFLVCYAVSRVRGIYRPLYWPFVALTGAFLVANALGNSGTLGGAHYYLIPALLIATVLARSPREAALASVAFAGAAIALVAVELVYPELVSPSPSRNARLLDVGGNLVFAQLFTSAVVAVLARNLNEERSTSERLLRNVLPEPVAEELKRRNRVAPRSYSSATVLFTDCVGFTSVAESMSAEDLVAALDEVFSAFDAIARRRGVEKIKTIGDAYMAVAGVPEPGASGAANAVLGALEMVAAADAIRARRERDGRPGFSIRVGLHTGPLVAGVIGDEKFAYDVWGDTVNTASRMESSGVPGRVNVSRATRDAVSHLFATVARGRLSAKNKGELEMYFVERLRPEYSADDLGLVPNEAFRVAALETPSD